MKSCKFGYLRHDGTCKLHDCAYNPAPKCAENNCQDGYFENDAPPRTNRDALLDRWAQDTERFARETISCFYDGYHESYDFPNGTRSYNETEAIKLYVAYLNSPAEVET